MNEAEKQNFNTELIWNFWQVSIYRIVEIDYVPDIRCDL